MTTNAAWRIPFGLFYIVPTIVASLIFLVPEVSYDSGPRYRSSRLTLFTVPTMATD